MEISQQTEKHIDEIQRVLAERETEDLLEIWVANDRDGWTEEAFMAIRRILVDRLGEVPPQIHRYQPVGSFNASIFVVQAKAYLNLVTLHILAKEHLDRAVGFVGEDELEDALQACELAIQTAPYLAAAHNYRGMILEELEQIDDAIDAYYEAVQLDPDFYAARENLCCARIKWEQALFRQIEEETLGTLEGLEDQPAREENFEMEVGFSFQEIDETFERYSGTLPAFYLDEKAFILRGWPGHRIRPGRSGYDPLDSDFELAHIEGVVFRLLITGKFRTRNPVYIFLMFFWGCLGCLSLIFTTAEAFHGYPQALLTNVIFTPHIVLGLTVLWNAALSLRDRKPEDDQASMTQQESPHDE